MKPSARFYRELYLDICGVRMNFRLPRGPLTGELERRYRYFLGEGRGAWMANVSVGPRLMLRGNPLPEVQWEEGGKTLRIERSDFRVEVHPRRRRMAVQVQESPHIFDNFLRAFFAAWLLRRQGLMLHAAGVEYRGRGYLLPGAVAAGKSTFSRRIGQERTLSDELSAVQWRRGRPWLMGTPFQGSFRSGGRNRAVPLEGIFLLRRRREAVCWPAGRRPAVMELVLQSISFENDARAAQAVLRQTNRLARRVPCFDYSFDRREQPERLLEGLRRAVATHPRACRRSSGRASGESKELNNAR